MIDEAVIRARYLVIKEQLDEGGRRLLVAAENVATGYGGTAAVSQATGVAHNGDVRAFKQAPPQ